MEFKITKATYNCATEEIDVEYSGKYNNEEITVYNEIDAIFYKSALIGNKLNLFGIKLEQGGYIISKTNQNTVDNIEFQANFYVNCKNICNQTPIKYDNSSGLSVYSINCKNLFELPLLYSNSEYLTISFIRTSTIGDYKSANCGKKYHNFGTLTNYKKDKFYFEVSGPTHCFYDSGVYNKEDFIFNVYNSQRCLIQTGKITNNSDLYNKFKINYNCITGLQYSKVDNLVVKFDGGSLPDIGTKLKSGSYNIKIFTTCPTNEDNCKSLPICFDLKVNCLNKSDKVNEDFCIEDANSIIKIDQLDGCRLRITNSINKTIKIRRVLLDSYNRSCSGNPLSVFDYIELLPLQYVDINNEGFGYDSKIEIEYKTGDKVCKNQICFPYCDLSVIGDRSDLKALVFKKGVSGDDSILTVFNPLGNDIVRFILTINGEDIIKNIVDGTQVAIKVDGNIRGAKYKFSSIKNYDIIKSGTVDLTKISEIPNGLLYTDLETVNGVEYFTIKMT